MTPLLMPAATSSSCSADQPGEASRRHHRSKWVSVVSHLDPKYGGLSAAVPALGSAVAATRDFEVELAGFCHNMEHYAPAVSQGVGVNYFPAGYAGWWKNSAARRSFRQLVSESSGVHIHGLWQLSTGASARAARAARKPYLVSAHGMLESWAIANKRWKKAAYAALVERKNLQAASCLHALTEAEARDYRNFGLKNPVAVIPNGVNIPVAVSAEPFFERFPELRSKRLMLFLGRIHFKKGLDILSRAWARLSSEWPDAQLVLAGPDFEDTRAEIERLLTSLKSRERVTFTGMLDSETKWSALRAADYFVLPSYSEGLSVSVLEAMGMGVPVIVTEQCNLPEVAAYECGWTIQPKVDELASALSSALQASARERSKTGENGRSLVERRYSWPAIGRQMAALYRWLEGGPWPSQFAVYRAEEL